MKKVLLLLSATLVFSCSQSTTTTVDKAVRTDSSVIKVQDSKRGADLSVKIDLPSSFTTKASVNGTPAKQLVDVKSLVVYLTTDSAGSLTGLVAGSQNTFSYPSGLTNGSKYYTFSNVPAGTYYAVAVAYDGSTTPLNIVKGGGLAVSSNMATVNSSFAYTFNPVSPANFTITLQLADAVGAQLDSAVTVVAGSPLPGNNSTVNAQ